MTSTRLPLACVAACLAVLLGACSPRASAPGDTPNAADTPPVAASDSATIARLEREARALVRTEGCGAANECRTAPVGSRPCGGPREYLVYCARTTDSAALFAKLDELAKAEAAWNQKRGIAGTCEMRLPPSVVISGNACRAAP